MPQVTHKFYMSAQDKANMATDVRKLAIAQLINTYSSSATYALGAFCNKDGVIYKCTTAINTAEAWNAEHWTVATLNEVIDAVTNAVSQVNGKVNQRDLEDGTIIPAKTQVAQALETEVGKYDRTPFAYMTSGGQTDIESGIQKTLKLVGVDVVKNQLLNLDSSNSNTNRGITHTLNGKTITATGTPTTTYSALNNPGCNIDLVVGHKYLVWMKIITNTTNLPIIFGTLNSIIRTNSIASGETYSIITATEGDSRISGIQGYTANTDIGTIVIEVGYVDLTQRYGSNDVVNAIIGTDTSKQVERLLQFDPAILEDTEYDTGSFPTIKSKYLKSVGYNLWDEEWKKGWIGASNGREESGASVISRNYIEVFANTKYGIYAGSGKVTWIYKYDKDYNYLGRNYANTSSGTWTNDSVTKYIKFICNDAYGDTYKNDISIFIYWDGSRIGYEKHEEKIEPLPNVQLHGILKVDSNGNVYADGDELYPDGVGNKRRYGSYTFTGEETWVAYGSGYRTVVLSDSKYKAIGGNVIPTNVITDCGLPLNTRNSIADGNDGISLNEDTIIVSSTTNLTGKTLIFELAEPTELEADTFNPNLWADDFGTLQFLDEDGNEIKGLQGCEIFYKANIAGFSESIYVKAEGEPDNVVVKEELQPFTDKDTQLLNALGGTLRQCLCVKESLDFNNTDFVDLGELNWSYSSSYAFFYTNISNGNPSTKYISTLYNNIGLAYDTAMGNSANLSMGYINDNGVLQIKVKNTSYTDTTTFKNAMKGILLAYEKASS